MGGRTLKLGETRYGSGVFAELPFRAGEKIIRLTGPVVDRNELPSPYEDFEDRFLQIGPEQYLGPSGELDDFINHCCDPNAGLKFSDDGIWVVAIRPIASGEEITFDYSTTMAEDDWELECHCPSPLCRGKIQDFRKLSPKLRESYIALRIVPDYLRKL